MPRSQIEIYWKTPETASDRVIAQVLVTDDSGSHYLLPYPCELTTEGWVNAVSRKPLAVRVTYWKPYVETCIEAFGAARCMFESNFPVDKGSYGYQAFWNACKLLAKGASSSEKADLFCGTAARFYRLDF